MMRNNNTHTEYYVPTRTNRRGAALLIVLVALVILMIMSATITRLIAARRRALLLEERRIQADRIAESAIDRARASLLKNPEYAGETWRIAASELGGRDDALVEIQVERVTDRPNRRDVNVRADYPIDPARRDRRSKHARITLNQ